MTRRRILYALAAVELTATVMLGSELMDAASSLGLPQIVGFVSDLLGGVDLGQVKDMIFSQ